MKKPPVKSEQEERRKLLKRVNVIATHWADGDHCENELRKHSAGVPSNLYPMPSACREIFFGLDAIGLDRNGGRHGLCGGGPTAQLITCNKCLDTAGLVRNSDGVTRHADGRVYDPDAGLPKFTDEQLKELSARAEKLLNQVKL